MNLFQRRKYEGRLLSAFGVDSHPEYILKWGKVSKAQIMHSEVRHLNLL